MSSCKNVTNFFLYLILLRFRTFFTCIYVKIKKEVAIHEDTVFIIIGGHVFFIYWGFFLEESRRLFRYAKYMQLVNTVIVCDYEVRCCLVVMRS